MKTLGTKQLDVESGKFDIEREKLIPSTRPIQINNQALLSGLSYCLSSCSMILVNKYVLSSYDFNAGISLMLYQNFISVFIVSMLSTLGVISTEALTWKLIKVWLPVNVIFVGMLITSMFSLRYINVAMVTVLKNVTNVITAVGEMYLFSKHHDNRVWVALFLMIISAISGGFTDLSFHADGYTWQIINCFLTASYSVVFSTLITFFPSYFFEKYRGNHFRNLKYTKSNTTMFQMSYPGHTAPVSARFEEGPVYPALPIFLIEAISRGFKYPLLFLLTLRRVMDTAKLVTESGNLNEFSMVLLNNTLSLPLGLLLIYVFNEVDYLTTTPLLRQPTFWLVMTLSGFLGLAISLSSMWFLHQTSATTYSLVGSLNKIPLSVAGILLFKVPTSLENSASILIGLIAGVFFARAKVRERSQS